MPVAITTVEGRLRITTPYSAANVEACRRIPEKRIWDKNAKAWFAKATPLNLQHLRKMFPDAHWDAQADALYEKEVASQKRSAGVTALQKRTLTDAAVEATNDYKHGGPAPWVHQKRAFIMSRDRTAFALFMQQRTGKTRVLIDTACWNFIRGVVLQVLVLAPNSVKTVWATDELPTHMPSYIQWDVAAWTPSPTKAEQEQIATVMTPDRKRMRWFVMNIEAMSTKKGADAAMRFVKQADTLVIIDESTRIKTPGAVRTRAVIALGKFAKMRRIATGTPAVQSPLDTYTQGKFLDPMILGFSSFYTFRNHFAIMGGWNNKQVINYAHLDELQALWDPHCFRITRDECFDIPPKGYQKLIVDMTPEQRALYRQMSDRMKAQLESGEKVTATIVLTQMLRLAQIAGGYMPVDDRAVAIPGGNPKIDALLEQIEDVQGKVIVWARFRAEIAGIVDALQTAYGPYSVVEFHGDVSEDDRLAARQAFQDPESPVRFFVGQTETGGLGLNLDQARTVIYYSNSFSLGARLQSEDRPMSGRQAHSVAVIDLIARTTIDEKVVDALRNKQELSRLVTGDKWKEWI